MYAYASTEIETQTSLFSDILQAGIVVQALLLSLIAMSIYSWAIIKKKREQMKDMEESNQKFLDLFWSSGTLEQVSLKAGHHASPLSRVFTGGYKELERLNKHKLSGDALALGMDNLDSALQKGQDQEVRKIESQLNFLATTGSTAPFIGLLGTVIGILNSFREIHLAGSASLATVAPGISEALVATAVGLFAAIPAVMAYNYLLGKVVEQENIMGDFIGEFKNLARLEFIQKS